MGGQPLTGRVVASASRNQHHQVYHHQMERKLKKPLMEKKRRARINRCLVELKHILLQSAPHQRSKLEKADILEMTVQYLRHKRESDLRTANRYYVDGFQQCSNAVLQYLAASSRPLSTGVADGLTNYLTSFLADKLGSSAAVPQHAEKPIPQAKTVGVLRPTPCLPLTLTIPTSLAQSSAQLLPTPPFTGTIQPPAVPFSGNFREFSPAPSCSSSESAASFFSFSPLSTGGRSDGYGKTPTNDCCPSTNKESIAVWRPW